MTLSWLRLGLACVTLATAVAAAGDVTTVPENRVAPDAPAWRELADAFARQPDLTTDFVEQRYFPFSKVPIVLRGEVRVSRAHGLSLHYTAPDERTVVLDDAGVLVRDRNGQVAPPDPRAAQANAAMLNILRCDLAALEKEFELYGRRTGETWSLVLVPRAETLRRALGNLHVSGEAANVRTVELRRSAKQHVDIAIATPRATTAFTAEELRRFFR